MKRIVVIVTALLILGLMNFSIWQKESHLNQGNIIRLKLAPVDPRSIMQGDYMDLNYQLAIDIRRALFKSADINHFDGNLEQGDGWVVAQLDDRNLASYVALDNGHPLSDNQIRLHYRVRNNWVKFATNAFFFEEGDEPRFRNAQYGEFRVNAQGEVLLTALLDAEFNPL